MRRVNPDGVLQTAQERISNVFELAINGPMWLIKRSRFNWLVQGGKNIRSEVLGDLEYRVEPQAMVGDL